MAKLHYKTRGNSAPQGKPRVWFCAHPDDHEPFLDPIARDLLTAQNCAVYYDEEPSAAYDADDFLSMLSHMNLFVMPITHRLLHTPNRAIDVELRHAVRHHIPVLPILQERGVEKDFNRICGDLQYLDPEEKDATAIPYGKKLATYLASVLIGDELAEQIRAEFDAYIFLSYRKKDRRHAQRLMRLIHRNDFCRDIAIWYDEFLTPGESFNDGIADALQKSAFVALAVTPNLVSETNYVMTVEYPKAKESAKPILPAELVPTDKTLLKALYENIPDTTDANDEAALSSALADTLQSLVIKENDGNPLHNYRIGLAYLGGIDVEIDHDRAFSLIVGAAEAKLPEAMKTLVSMYRNGDGVMRDLDKSLLWQRRLVEHTRDRYRETCDEHDAHAYVTALRDLGDQLCEARRMEEAKACYTELLTVCEEMHERFANLRTITDLGLAHGKLGDISNACGDPLAAKQFFMQAMAINEIIAEKTDSIEAKRNLSVSCNRLGDLAQAEGNLREARMFFMKALSIREHLANEIDDADTKCDLSVSYNRLGEIAQKLGSHYEAHMLFREALLLREAIASETGTVKARRDLYVSYERLGNLAQALGDLNTAKLLLTKCLEICEELMRETESFDSMRDLSILTVQVGDIAQDLGNTNEAQRLFLQGIEISEKLVRETEDIEAWDNLAVACYNAAFAIPEQKASYLTRALAIWTDLAHRYPNVKSFAERRDLVKECM